MARPIPRVDDVPPLATLFCPGCDHRNPVDGDWRREPTTRGTRLRCPECAAVLTVRPEFDDPADGRSVVDPGWPLHAFATALRVWRTVWRPRNART